MFIISLSTCIEVLIITGVSFTSSHKLITNEAVKYEQQNK